MAENEEIKPGDKVKLKHSSEPKMTVGKLADGSVECFYGYSSKTEYPPGVCKQTIPIGALEKVSD